MFRTLPLLSILPKIQHAPLLTRRESQKLLDVLKTTFREKLDEEPNAPSTDVSSSISSRRQPTDRHLDTILSNPLFSHARAPAETPPEDHMAVFDHAVSKGMMNIKAATGCLRATRKQLLRMRGQLAHDAMAASAAGSRVVHWLRSSGQERTLEFASSASFLTELLPFLLAEQMEGLVWIWLDQLLAVQGSAEHQHRAGILLLELVRAESHPSHDYSLDSALATVVRADQLFSANPGFRTVVSRSWGRLSRGLTLPQLPRRAPSEILFDSFVGTSNSFKMWDYLAVALPHLDLHHPTKPTPNRALDFVRDKTLWDRFWQRSPRKISFQPQLVTMGVDLVSHLERLGDLAEARSITELLKTRLSAEHQTLSDFRSHATGELFTPS